MNLPVLAAPSSALRSSTSQIQPLPHLPVLRVNSPNSPVASQPSFRHFTSSSSQPHPTTSQDGSVVDGGETYGSFIEQIRSCAATIQSCAEHQKRMTDDVLQLSRLRSHKLEILNSYYRPWEMVQTTLRAFGVQANNKVGSLLTPFLCVLLIPPSTSSLGFFFNWTSLTSFVSGIGVETGVKRFGRAVRDLWRQHQDTSNSIQPSIQCNQVHSPGQHHSHC